MIKRILLKGISRTLSDRLMQDGGCEESLNVQCIDGEVQPIIPPTDITSARELPTNNGDSRPMFIHHFNEQDVFIYTKTTGEDDTIETSVRYWMDSDWVEICSIIGADWTDLRFTSMGKTLIVSCKSNTHYAILQSDGTYKYLGTHIPRIQFALTDREIYLKDEGNGYTGADGFFNPERFENAPIPNGKQNNDYRVTDNDQQIILGELWSMHDAIVTSRAKQGIFVYPSLFRVALRLYDGSLYDVSPILIVDGCEVSGGRFTTEMGIAKSSGTYSADAGKTHYHLKVKRGYRVLMRHSIVGNLDDWEDVLKGVEVYSAGQVIPRVDTTTAKMTSLGTSADFDGYSAITLDPLHQQGSGIEEAIKSYRSFHLVKEFTLDELGGGVEITEDMSFDHLYTQESLDDIALPHDIIPNESMVFNQRVIAGNVTRVLSCGHCYPTGLSAKKDVSHDSTLRYLVKYTIRTDEGDKVVCSASPTALGLERVGSGINPYGDSNRMVQSVNGKVMNYDSSSLNPVVTYTEQSSMPCAWISYPDDRCIKAEIYTFLEGDTGVYYREVDMKEFPNSNCAYGFLGWGTPWKGDDEYTESEVIAESVRENLGNMLLQSSVANPWVFPRANDRELPASDIIGIATATKALSSGQFGQYPVYAFTTDGIYALSTANDGTLTSPRPLSREVSIKGTICPIDHAVVFTTERGVMLLSGSNIECLSMGMNGRPSPMSATTQPYTTVASVAGYAKFLEPLTDGSAFLQFMNGAKASYDYSGNRLIFFVVGKSYQFVYRFDTKTWHKMQTEGAQFISTMNSYPHAYAAVAVANPSYNPETGEGYEYLYRILDYSTNLAIGTSQDSLSIKGVITTRPFDMEAQDVYKTINRLKLRSDRIGSAKYILLASNDLYNWRVLHSLRGPSWKWHKLVILTDMHPSERLSYVEMDYENRFLNKLR